MTEGRVRYVAIECGGRDSDGPRHGPYCRWRACQGRKGWLRVLEKVEAVMELHTCLMIGGLGHTAVSGMQATLNHYRGKVAANNERLGRKR